MGGEAISLSNRELSCAEGSNRSCYCHNGRNYLLLLVQIPSNQLLRIFGSSTWLTTLIIAWGIVSGFGCLISSPTGYIVQVCCLRSTGQLDLLQLCHSCPSSQSQSADQAPRSMQSLAPL